jgi:hypothetical protein
VQGNYGIPNWLTGFVRDYPILPSTQLVYGSNKHNHTVEDPGTSQTEVQPAALEEDIVDFITPVVEPRSTPLATTAVAAAQSPPYEGKRNKIIPEDHSHIVRVSEEDLEPPRIKLKICEKI